MSANEHRKVGRLALELMPAISRAIRRGDTMEAFARLALLYRDAGAATHADALALAHVALDQLVAA